MRGAPNRSLYPVEARDAPGKTEWTDGKRGPVAHRTPERAPLQLGGASVLQVGSLPHVVLVHGPYTSCLPVFTQLRSFSL